MVLAGQQDAAARQLPDSIQTVTLPDGSENALETALADIRTKAGKIRAFIHLHSSIAKNPKSGGLFASEEKSVLKQVFFLAKHLKNDLIAQAESSRGAFMVVTQMDGKLGFENINLEDAIAGGFYGLVKTINIEWESVFCRVIDLAADLDGVAAGQAVISELHDSDTRLVEVGYDKNVKRRTLIAEVDNSEHETDSTSNLDESSVFLVSGGAKGVTASCVVELSRQRKCGFILLGRSEYQQDEPEWSKNCDDLTELKKRCMNSLIDQGEKPTPIKIMGILNPILSAREIGQTISTLKENGSAVEYISIDITDQQALANKLSTVTAKMGAITGVIHGAGVLADKLIENKTEKDFDAVFQTKIEGLEAMLEVVPKENLKHIVLFSSAAGFYGNEAQSDYATANEILNKFSHAYKSTYPGSHVISINWGPWDGGMVTPELKRLFQERNIAIIPVDVGSAIMTNELRPDFKDITQIVVGNSMIVPKQLTGPLMSYEIKRSLVEKDNPFLIDHQIGNEPVMPIICAVSWMIDSCERLYPGYYATAVEDVKVLKGVVFTDEKPIDLAVAITEIEKSDETGKVGFDVKIGSVTNKGLPLFHYSCRVKLGRQTQAIEKIGPDFSQNQQMDGQGFYKNGTLFHGPLFQIVREQLNYDQKHLTLKCNVTPLPESKQGQFPVNRFNHYADDADLQALLIWARHTHNAGSLPLSIQKMEFNQKAPFGEEFFVSASIESSSASQVIATVISHDREGNVYSRMTGASVSVSEKLNEKFLNKG